MKKAVVIVLATILIFGGLSSAAKQNKKIENAINKLEEAQQASKEGNKKEAFEILGKVKSWITEAMFSLSTIKPKRKLLTNNWLVKFTKGPYLEYDEGWGEYFINMDITAENLSNQDREPCFSTYAIDPKGVQQTGVTLSPKVIAGAKDNIGGYVYRKKKADFVPGTYTIILEPHCDIQTSEEKQLRFKLEVTEEDLE